MNDSDPSSPKRRWLQFSLRTFFVLMTAFAVWFGWAMHNARQQRKGVAWVEELGGTVKYDYQIDEDGVRLPNAEPPGSKWVRGILGIDFMDDVVLVDFTGKQVSDVTALAGLKKLQWLSLNFTRVSDLSPLAGLKNLEMLDLNGTPVIEEQVTTLQQAMPDCTIYWSPPE